MGRVVIPVPSISGNSFEGLHVIHLIPIPFGGEFCPNSAQEPPLVVGYTFTNEERSQSPVPELYLWSEPYD